MQRLLNPVYKTLLCDLKMQKQWILGLSLINRHKSRTVLWDHRLIQIFEKVPSALWTKTTGDQSSPRGTASPCTTQNWECAPHCVIIIILWHQTNWRVKNLSWLFWGSSTLVRCWWENVACQEPSSWAYKILPPNYVRMPGQLSIIIATERVIFVNIWVYVTFFMHNIIARFFFQASISSRLHSSQVFPWQNKYSIEHYILVIKVMGGMMGHNWGCKVTSELSSISVQQPTIGTYLWATETPSFQCNEL